MIGTTISDGWKYLSDIKQFQKQWLHLLDKKEL